MEEFFVQFSKPKLEKIENIKNSFNNLAYRHLNIIQERSVIIRNKRNQLNTKFGRSEFPLIF